MPETKNKRDIYQYRWDLKDIEEYPEKYSSLDYNDKMKDLNLEGFLSIFDKTETKKTRHEGRFIIPGEEFIRLDNSFVNKILSQTYSKKCVETLNKMIDDVMVNGQEETRSCWNLEISYNGLFVLKKKIDE